MAVVTLAVTAAEAKESMRDLEKKVCKRREDRPEGNLAAGMPTHPQLHTLPILLHLHL